MPTNQLHHSPFKIRFLKKAQGIPRIVSEKRGVESRVVMEEDFGDYQVLAEAILTYVLA